MNEDHTPKIKVTSFAQVMKTIFYEHHVPHKKHVKLRKRVEQLYRIQRPKTVDDKLEPQWIAFAMLSFLEQGRSVDDCLSMMQRYVMDRAREAKATYG